MLVKRGQDAFAHSGPRAQGMEWSCFGDLKADPKEGPHFGHETGSNLRSPNMGCHFLGAEIVTIKRASFWDLKKGACGRGLA
jgi:hypothetical protein